LSFDKKQVSVKLQSSYLIVMLFWYVNFTLLPVSHEEILALHVMYMCWYWYYLWTAIGLTPDGSSTVHIYTQTIHRTHRTQLTTLVGKLSGIRTQNGQTNWEEGRPCLIFAHYTLAFASQWSKKHGKTSVRVVLDICKLLEVTEHMHYSIKENLWFIFSRI